VLLSIEHETAVNNLSDLCLVDTSRGYPTIDNAWSVSDIMYQFTVAEFAQIKMSLERN